MDPVTLGMAKADAKKNYSPRAAFATERAPIPVVDCRSRTGYNGSSDGTVTGGNYRYRHTALVTAGGIRLAYGNYNCVSGIETEEPMTSPSVPPWRTPRASSLQSFSAVSGTLLSAPALPFGLIPLGLRCTGTRISGPGHTSP